MFHQLTPPPPRQTLADWTNRTSHRVTKYFKQQQVMFNIFSSIKFKVQLSVKDTFLILSMVQSISVQTKTLSVNVWIAGSLPTPGRSCRQRLIPEDVTSARHSWPSSAAWPLNEPVTPPPPTDTRRRYQQITGHPKLTSADPRGLIEPAVCHPRIGVWTLYLWKVVPSPVFIRL